MRGCSSVPVLMALCAGVGVISMPCAEAGIIEGVNHTHWAINRFSVDGRSGLDTIGPWQRGGGGYFSLPARWSPELMVRIDWETGVAYPDGFPGYGDRARYRAWVEDVEAQRRQHSKLVAVPNFAGQEVCGITVHFLPCDEIQVATSCYPYGHPQYPIKTPLNLPEPQSCQATGPLAAQGAS